MYDNNTNDNMTNKFLGLFKRGLKYGYVVIEQFVEEERMGIEERDVLEQGKAIFVNEWVSYPRYYSINEVNYFNSKHLIKDENGLYTNVFFSPFIYKCWKREQKHSLYLTALYIDLDDYCNLDEAKSRLTRLPAELQQPTAILCSGGGVHIYWILDYKHKVTKYLYLWKKTMTKLKDILEGDPQVIDHARLMRLPGTWNPKSNGMCELITLNLTNEFDLFEVAKSLGTYKERDYKKKSSYSQSKKKRNNQKKRYFSNGYTQQLKDEIIELIKLRAKSGDDMGYRHHVLLTLKQLRATNETLDYINQEVFSESLSAKEVNYIKEYDVGDRELFFPKRSNVVDKLQITAEEQKLFRYLVDEDVYETRKAITFIKGRPLYSLTGYLLKLLQRKYTKKKNASLKVLAKELKISTKTASKFRSSRNQKEDYLQVDMRLNEVKQEVERVTTTYLSTLTKDKNKQPVVEELQEFQEFLEKLEVLIEQSKEFQKKRLTMTEYKKLLQLIKMLEELRNECM
jgi:hypothetical protein